MADAVTQWRDVRIPASLWVISISVSLAAVPLLFFTDIAVVGLGILGLMAMIASFDDRYRLFILVALIPFAHAGIGLSEMGGFGPYDIFLGWFVLLYLWRIGPITLFQVEVPRTLWLGGLMVLSFIPSVMNSGTPSDTLKAFVQLSVSVLTTAGVFEILRRRNDILLIRKVLILFVAVASGASLYGLLQTILSGSLVSVAVGRTYFSLFQDVNYYSGYLLMAVAVAVGLIFSTRHFVAQILIFGAIGVLIVAIIATVSRSAIAVLLFLTMAYAGYFVLQRGISKWMGVLMAAGVIGILSIVVFTDLGKRMVDLFTVSRRIESVIVGQDASLQQRANILVVTMSMIESHPVVGVGFGSFEQAFEFYKGTYLSTGFKRSAHNTYLRIAAETGVVGLCGFGLFVLSLMVTVLRGVRLAFHTPSGVVFLSLAFSLVAFLLMSLTLDQMFEPQFWIVAGVSLAFGSVLREGQKENGPNA